MIEPLLSSPKGQFEEQIFSELATVVVWVAHPICEVHDLFVEIDLSSLAFFAPCEVAGLGNAGDVVWLGLECQ